MKTTTTVPAVYCGTYAKYNNGSIAGAWLKLADYETADDFWKACKELHKDEADPEYMFQDFEGFPKDEYNESGMDFDKLIEYARMDEDQREIVDAYIDATGYSMKDFELSEVEDKVIFREDTSSFMSMAEQYGYEYADSCMDIPESIQPYFDYERFGEDLLQDYSEANGFVFDNY